MYSPKISEALIPRIYRAAKEAKIPMTRWVNRAVERALPETGVTQEQFAMVANVPVPDSSDSVPAPAEKGKRLNIINGRVGQDNGLATVRR